MSSNQLNGNIPDSIGHPFNGERPLRGLYLSDNQFEGSIPRSLCELENLEALFLDENRLDGSIPDCVGLLESLQQLYLFKNNLSGEVPVGLSSLRQLCKYLSFARDILQQLSPSSHIGFSLHSRYRYRRKRSNW